MIRTTLLLALVWRKLEVMTMFGVRTVAKLVHVGALIGLLAAALLACKKNKDEEKALPEVEVPEAGTPEPAAPAPAPTPAEVRDEAPDEETDAGSGQPSSPGTVTRPQPRADAGSTTPRADAGGGSTTADAGGGSSSDAGGGTPAPTPEQIRSCISRCQGQLQQCLSTGNNAECNTALRTCISGCRGN